MKPKQTLAEKLSGVNEGETAARLRIVEAHIVELELETPEPAISPEGPKEPAGSAEPGK